MTTLAIDAATTTGIAMVNGAELLHASVVMTRSNTLQRLALLQTLPTPDRVAIERPQLRTVGDDKASQGKAQGTLAVSRHVGMWQALCELAYPGVTVVHVYPATWRSALRFPSGDRKHLKARFGNKNGVLPLGRKAVIFGDDGPAIGKLAYLRTPCVNHGLDGEGHTRLKLQTCARLSVVKHLRLFMKDSPNAMATELADN